MSDAISGSHLPVWDKALARWLMPAAPFFDLMLVLIGLSCFWAVWAFRKHPEWKALYIAFLASP